MYKEKWGNWEFLDGWSGGDKTRRENGIQKITGGIFVKQPLTQPHENRKR